MIFASKKTKAIAWDKDVVWSDGITKAQAEKAVAALVAEMVAAEGGGTRLAEPGEPAYVRATLQEAGYVVIDLPDASQVGKFGGPGSGDYGHTGRPGEVGGSASGGGSASKSAGITRAKRGDLVVVVRKSRDFVIGQGSQERTDIHVGIATSVSREGLVKTYRGGLIDSATPVGHDQVYVVSAKEIDVERAYAAAREHAYPGHPDQAMPFDSLEEVKALLRPFRSVQASEQALEFGGPGSGDYGHSGRPGEVGGSAGGGGAQTENDRQRIASGLAFLRERVAAFRQAGGQVKEIEQPEFLRSGHRLQNQVTRMKAAADMEGSKPARIATTYMRACLLDMYGKTELPGTKLLVAQDAQGHLVGALSYRPSDVDAVKVEHLGSARALPGTGSALQAALIERCAAQGMRVASTLDNRAVGFHVAIGRQVDGVLSDWSHRDIAALAAGLGSATPLAVAAAEGGVPAEDDDALAEFWQEHWQSLDAEPAALEFGSSTSGDYGHAGRPGQVGGSAPGGGGSADHLPKALRTAVLEEEKRYHGLGHEEAAYFRRSGKLVARYGGSEHRVNAPDLGGFVRDAVFTHYHPAIGSFSPNDLIAARNENLSETRAVDDQYTYSARRPEGGWPDSNSDFVKDLDALLSAPMDVFRQLPSYRTSSAEDYHQGLSRVLAKYGIPYVRTPAPGAAMAEWVEAQFGGQGSGDWGHAGRPGQVGGSAGGGGGGGRFRAYLAKLSPGERAKNQARFTPSNSRQQKALAALLNRPGQGPHEVDGEAKQDTIRPGYPTDPAQQAPLAAAIAGRPSQVENVPLDQLTATKEYLSRTAIAATIKNLDGDPDFQRPGYLPLLAKQGGKTYIVDGHHRTEGALLLGRKAIQARVFDLDSPLKSGEELWQGSEWSELELLEFGGPGSGDYGHAGRPGEVGGSGAGGGLGEVESGFRQNLAGPERAVALLPDGRQVQVEGLDREVRISAKQGAEFKGAVLTHSHPLPYAFSRSDIEVAGRMGLRELRAVTSEGTYSLRRSDGQPLTEKDTKGLLAHAQSHSDEAYQTARSTVPPPGWIESFPSVDEALRAAITDAGWRNAVAAENQHLSAAAAGYSLIYEHVAQGGVKAAEKLDFGGPGSGDYGHVGRPGEVGGSGAGGGGFDPLPSGERAQASLATALGHQAEFFNNQMTNVLRSGLQRANAAPGPAPRLSAAALEAAAKGAQSGHMVEIGGRAHPVSAYIKDAIVADLAQRSGLGYEKTDAMVEAWSETSGDSHPASLILQDVVAQRFGLPRGSYLESKLAQVGVSDQEKADARAFVDAVYAKTQADLQAAGVKEVYVYRGMNFRAPGVAPMNSMDERPPLPEQLAPTGQEVSVRLNPLSSFSLSPAPAYDFATPYKNIGAPEGYAVIGRVLSQRLPAAQIFSTCLSGVGCLREREVVVLGGQHQAYVSALEGGAAEMSQIYKQDQLFR
jgi:hypothetical protein